MNGIGVALRTMIAALTIVSAGCGRTSPPATDGSAKPDSTPRSAIAIGAPAPVYAARTLTGSEIHIGTSSDSITLLNVWATWCTSCREEMADLEALHRAYAPRGIRVVAVSLDAGSPGLVQRFVQREALTFSVVHDREARLQSLYHIGGVPSSYLIDRDGRLLWQLTGGMHGASSHVRAVIDSALDARRGARVGN